MQLQSLPRPLAALGSFFALFIASHAAAVVLHPGDLIVTDNNNASLPGYVLDINPITGAQTLISSGGLLVQPDGVAIDRLGNIIVSDFGGLDGSFGSILKIDLATGNQTVVSTGGNLVYPTSVNIDPNGQLLVTQQGVGLVSGAVLRIDPTTGAQTVIASLGSITTAEDAVVDPHGGILVSSFQSISGIVRVDPATSQQTVLTSGNFLGSGIFDICVDQNTDHNLLVAGNSGLVSVNTLTGDQSILSTGGFIHRLLSVSQNSSGLTYVTDGPDDNTPGSVLAINLQTGTQTVISSGGYLITPNGIIVVPEPTGLAGMILAASLFFLHSSRRTCKQ